MRPVRLLREYPPRETGVRFLPDAIDAYNVEQTGRRDAQARPAPRPPTIHAGPGTSRRGPRRPSPGVPPDAAMRGARI